MSKTFTDENPAPKQKTLGWTTIIKRSFSSLISTFWQKNPLTHATSRLPTGHPAKHRGALIRLCAGLSVSTRLIEPFGYIWDEKKNQILRHGLPSTLPKSPATSKSFSKAFLTRGIVLLDQNLHITGIRGIFQTMIFLLLGRESAGVPREIHDTIPHHCQDPDVPSGQIIE